ncbi:DUF2264 domain-containing protein [Paenibacillus sp. NPDC056579]|uniref:DUF2264 domain-containing protein n=1 Tax=Paenibacillus sp. NPDC056579 TaxID=3345871 RepID=UPI0036831565
MTLSSNDRLYWLQTMERIAGPVLKALSERQLKATMPVAVKRDETLLSRHGEPDRLPYMNLEALGRTLAGLASWLESGPRDGEEGRLRERFADMARTAIDAGTDPASPDACNFSVGLQPLVDAAFLAHAVLRAPIELGEKLEPRVRRQLVASLKATRTRKPAACNWLLFSAMIETALRQLGEPDWDRMRIDYALKQHQQWYKGDGVYGDGPDFHWDYYNSFVIQPMMLDIVEAVSGEESDWASLAEPLRNRAVRFAEVQERLISPEGTFPPIGRSIVYRFGAFQHLAQMALRRDLPFGVEPAQVRGALSAVIRRTMEQPGTFDANGWLTIGLCGHQPDLGEVYISTGSLYLCCTVFLPLGLQANDPFWMGEADWTSKKAWSGVNLPADKSIYV